jgi:hypothetical protein
MGGKAADAVIGRLTAVATIETTRALRRRVAKLLIPVLSAPRGPLLKDQPPAAE